MGRSRGPGRHCDRLVMPLTLGTRRRPRDRPGSDFSLGRADYLSLEDELEIAEGVVDQPTVCDLGLLASAAARPRMSVFGADAYPALTSKAAALMESIARNHTLVDGNKRLAWPPLASFC